MQATPVQIYGIPAGAVTVDGAVFYVPDSAARRPVSQKILNGHYAEPDLHWFVNDTLARLGGSIVHAGTFFGDMLPSFSRKTPTPGRVYAFEPVVENYLLARAVVETNRLDNVTLFHTGLGTDVGTAQVKVAGPDGRMGGKSHIVADDKRRAVQTQTVPVLAIDNLGMDDLTLLQLDVEGHELSVLRGAARTIAASRPAIVVEDLREECGDFLAELDYRARGKVDRNHLFLTDDRAADLGYEPAAPR